MSLSKNIAWYRVNPGNCPNMTEKMLIETLSLISNKSRGCMFMHTCTYIGMYISFSIKLSKTTLYLSVSVSLGANCFLFKTRLGSFLEFQSKTVGTAPFFKVFRTGVHL